MTRDLLVLISLSSSPRWVDIILMHHDHLILIKLPKKKTNLKDTKSEKEGALMRKEGVLWGVQRLILSEVFSNSLIQLGG